MPVGCLANNPISASSFEVIWLLDHQFKCWLKHNYSFKTDANNTLKNQTVLNIHLGTSTQIIDTLKTKFKLVNEGIKPQPTRFLWWSPKPMEGLSSGGLTMMCSRVCATTHCCIVRFFLLGCQQYPFSGMAGHDKPLRNSNGRVAPILTLPRLFKTILILVPFKKLNGTERVW